VRTASIIRAMNAPMMKAVLTSETSVYSNKTTRRYIPEGYNNLHIHRREDLKSHLDFLFVVYVTTLFEQLRPYSVKLSGDSE
jgi:hypothetical protein